MSTFSDTRGRQIKFRLAIIALVVIIENLKVQPLGLCLNLQEVAKSLTKTQTMFKYFIQILFFICSNHRTKDPGTV